MHKWLFCAALLALCPLWAKSAAKADSLATLDNPERGFYHTCGMGLKTKDTKVPQLPGGMLVHLRLDISAFSTKAGGKDAPISEDALKALKTTLENIRTQGKGVIIRSCYDPGFGGKKDMEPDLKLMQQHLKQLGAVYSAYADIIVCLELGTFGPWGEMHSSKCCTYDNVNAALDALLAATPSSMTVNLRTPQYVAGWFGLNPMDKLDGSSSAFLSAMKAKGKNAARIGLFNDGYLGSSSDLGTFAAVPRAAGVAWLKKAATHTFYGGEAVADSSGASQGAFNTLKYISTEGFETHTTYLNVEWNQRVHKAWKEDTYRHSGDEYDGQNGFKYVQDHLGYRIVMRHAKVQTKALKEKKLNLRVTLENVGFAPVIKSKKAEVVVVHKSGSPRYVLPSSKMDIRTLGAASSHTFNLSLPLKGNMPSGTWSVYLRLACPGYESAKRPPCIRFAGTEEDWNAEEGLNFLCTFKSN